METTALQGNPQFQLLTELGHNDIAPFVLEYYAKRRTWVTVTHYIASMLLGGAGVFTALRQKMTLDTGLTAFGAAVIASVLILPIHEAIHGAVYRLLGARDIRYGVSLRKFYAYAIAHNFVADRVAFAWVAATPFLVINGLLLLAALLWPHYGFFFLAMLLIHTAGTSGDWAMLNYLWLHRSQEIYTFDDAVEHKSYFYGSAPAA